MSAMLVIALPLTLIGYLGWLAFISFFVESSDVERKFDVMSSGRSDDSVSVDFNEEDSHSSYFDCVEYSDDEFNEGLKFSDCLEHTDDNQHDENHDTRGPRTILLRRPPGVRIRPRDDAESFHVGDDSPHDGPDFAFPAYTEETEFSYTDKLAPLWNGSDATYLSISGPWVFGSFRPLI